MFSRYPFTDDRDITKETRPPNPIASIKKLALQSKASPLWPLLGWMNIVTLVLVLSFYSVVAGWSIKYALMSLLGFLQQANNTHHQIWQHDHIKSNRDYSLPRNIYVLNDCRCNPRRQKWH